METSVRLLVSVRSAAEAEIAVAAGADLIDIKEPLRGALGAADPQVIAEIVAAVADRVAVSAALGELRDGPATPTEVCRGLAWAKLGLAGCAAHADWPDRWNAWVVQLPPEVAAVAVIYADWRTAGAPSPVEIHQVACKLQCRALLIDTFDKSQGALLDLMSLSQLGALIDAAREAGMLAVAAGSLSAQSIRQILPLNPDYIAVRTAVCGGGRAGSIEANRVRSLAQLLRERVGAAANSD